MRLRLCCYRSCGLIKQAVESSLGFWKLVTKIYRRSSVYDVLDLRRFIVTSPSPIYLLRKYLSIILTYDFKTNFARQVIADGADQNVAMQRCMQKMALLCYIRFCFFCVVFCPSSSEKLWPSNKYNMWPPGMWDDSNILTLCFSCKESPITRCCNC